MRCCRVLMGKWVGGWVELLTKGQTHTSEARMRLTPMHRRRLYHTPAHRTRSWGRGEREDKRVGSIDT